MNSQGSPPFLGPLSPSQQFHTASSVDKTAPLNVETQLLDLLRSRPQSAQPPMASPQLDDVMNRLSASGSYSSVQTENDVIDRPLADPVSVASSSSVGRNGSGSHFREYSPTSFKPDSTGGRTGIPTLQGIPQPLAAEYSNGISVSNGFKVPDLPTGLSPASSRAPSRQNSSSKDAVTILYSNPATQEEDIIQSRLTSLIPQHALEHLMTLGECMTQGNRKIIDLGSTFGHTATRLKQFLEHKSYVPFIPPRRQLQVFDPDNRPIDWPVRGGLVPKKSTEKTLSLFCSELLMYKRMSAMKYDEIRLYSSKNIRTGYPIFKEEVIALLERVYETAAKNKDAEMIDFIVNHTQKFSDELMSTPAIRAILQNSINEDSPGRIILDMVLKTNSKAQANLFLDSALSQTPTGPKELPTPTSPSTSSKSTAFPQPPSDVANMRKIYEILVADRLLVAKSDGYGTLINGPGFQKRNRDFRFERSELLLADFESPSTRHNMTVMNSRGQKGDILASFVNPIFASSLGIDGERIHLGSADTKDREQRMFRPGTGRGRSRSPERR